MMYIPHKVGNFIIVIDYNNNGVFMGFRVGTPSMLIYDTNDTPTNDSVIKLLNK